MRPRASLAAMSSVGKHTARESEAPNVVRMGKSAWRAPTPEFGPDPARGPGLFLNVENHFSLSVRRTGPGPEPTYPRQVRRADLRTPEPRVNLRPLVFVILSAAKDPLRRVQ